MRVLSILRRGLAFPDLCVAMLFVTIAALACLSPAQSDTFWALRAGQDIWHTGRIPLVDTYSYTAAGRPWPNHEWLWQAIAYAMYWLGGFPLLSAFSSAVLTAAYAIAYRLTSGPRGIRLALLSVATTLGAIGWSLRPQIVTLLFVSLLLWLLFRPRYWLIPPLFALWANLHGGVVFGGGILLLSTGYCLVADRSRFWPLALTTAIAGAATLLTPLGLDLWVFIVRWSLAARLTGVSEWDPMVLAGARGLLATACGLSFVVLAALRWKAAADRLPLVIALATLLAALRAIRNVPMFLLVAAIASSQILGRRLASAPARIETASTKPRKDNPRANLSILIAWLAVAITTVAACWMLPIAHLGWRPLSSSAAAAIAACPEPIYNSYEAGGFLVWFVPGKRVFIDSRHDPYPVELIIADRELEQGRKSSILFEEYDFKCAVVAQGSGLGETLQKSRYRPRYRDSQWLVLEPLK
jgi:hypothetical protein